MSIEKIYCNESRKSLILQILLEASSFRFHFVSALQYLDCCYNESLVKQTASLYLKFPSKPAFFRVFLLFLERSVFACFKLMYF